MLKAFPSLSGCFVRLCPGSFFNGFLAYGALFVLLYVIFSANWIVRNYYAARFGFLPEYVVFFDAELEQDTLSRLAGELSSEANVAGVLNGMSIRLDGVSFAVENRVTLPRTVLALGVDFIGNKHITLEQNGRRFRLSLRGYSGGAFLDVSESADLRPGYCTWIEGDHRVGMEVFSLDSQWRLFLAEGESEAAFFRAFSSVLTRFVPPSRSGIVWDRFGGVALEEMASGQAGQRFCEAFGSLIFTTSSSRPRILASSSLQEGIDHYGGMEDAVMQWRDRSAELRILDGLAFYPEQHLPRDALIMKHSDFTTLFDDASAKPFIFIYGGELTSPPASVIGLSGIRIFTRGDLLPGLSAQESVFRNALLLMKVLLCVVVLFTSIATIGQFYAVNRNSMFFLKILGQKFGPATWSLALGFLAVIGPAALALWWVHRINNQMFATYYFPTWGFSWSHSCASLVTCFILILITFTLELIWFSRITSSEKVRP